MIQPPVVQIIPPPFAIPAPLQPPPVAVAAPPSPVIIIRPPPKQAAQGGRKHTGLETIPEEEDEEEEEDEHKPQGAEYCSPSSSSSSFSATASFSTEEYGTPPDTPARQTGKSGSPFGDRGKNILAYFRHLAFAPDADTHGWEHKIPTDERGEGAAKVLVA